MSTLTASTYEGFLDHLRENPEDWGVYLIFADYCEEQGEQDKADCLRWQAKERKRPRAIDGMYDWYDYEEMLANQVHTVDPMSDLPKELYKRLPQRPRNPELGRGEYRSVIKAQEALFKAWKRAKQ